MATTRERIVAELADDPEGLGYAGKDRQEQLDLLHLANRPGVPRARVAGADLFNLMTPAEWDGLSQEQKLQVLALATVDVVDPDSAPVAALFSDRLRLVAKVGEQIDRLHELGITGVIVKTDLEPHRA